MEPIPTSSPKRNGKLAFEAEPSTRLFRLRLARYWYVARTLGEILPKGETLVLDAACGKGRLPLYWERWGRPDREPRFVGVDLSPRRLAQARERGYGGLVRADLLEPWPFPDGAFDAAVCEQVLEHLEGRPLSHFLGELVRVLRPGGPVLIGVPIFTPPEIWLAPLWRPVRAWMRRARGDGHPAHVRQFSLASLRSTLRDHRLVVGTARGYRIFTLPWNLLEDRAWYFRSHQWFGRRLPWLCGEVTVTARVEPRT